MFNNDLLKLRAIYRELSEQFNFSCPCYLEIVISNRLRSSNGYCQTLRRYGELAFAKIVMSKALLDEFGWDKFETTFKHEVAHLAQIIIERKRGNHNETFKKLCSQFGGTMNRKLAGAKYSRCADADYVKTIKKWFYTCPCGYVKKMAKRMNKNKRGNKGYRCGRCRTTLDNWVETRVA